MAEMIPFDGSEERAEPKPGSPEPDSSSANEPRQSYSEHQSYSNEEVSEIIRVALRNRESIQTDSVDHEEMLAIGRDFGLGSEDIARAFDEIHKSRSQDDLQSQAVLAFKLHALTFGVVQLGLLAINILTGTDDWWVLYPFFAWGTVLLLHGVLLRYVPSASLVIIERTGKMAMDSLGYDGLDAPSKAAVGFTIPDQHGGMAESKGILQLQKKDLLIESQTQDTVLGILKGDIKEIHVPYADIASVRLERQFWVTKLILQSHRMKTFSKVPGQDGGRVSFTIDKNALDSAEQLARELAERIN